MTRALLGDYQDILFWRRAFESLMDSVPEERGGEWMRSLRRVRAESFVPRMRQQSAALYSACSKGVHHEFVVAAREVNDPDSVKALLRESIEVAAVLGIVANASPDMYFRIDSNEALACFETLQESI